MKNAQSEVSVIGLGVMGSALARTLFSHGYQALQPTAKSAPRLSARAVRRN